jgi:hypothetical protein
MTEPMIEDTQTEEFTDELSDEALDELERSGKYSATAHRCSSGGLKS